MVQVWYRSKGRRHLIESCYSEICSSFLSNMVALFMGYRLVENYKNPIHIDTVGGTKGSRSTSVSMMSLTEDFWFS